MDKICRQVCIGKLEKNLTKYQLETAEFSILTMRRNFQGFISIYTLILNGDKFSMCQLILSGGVKDGLTKDLVANLALLPRSCCCSIVLELMFSITHSGIADLASMNSWDNYSILSRPQIYYLRIIACILRSKLG